MELLAADNLEIVKAFGMVGIQGFNKSVGFIQDTVALDFDLVLFSLVMLFFMKLESTSLTIRILWAKALCKIL